MYEFVCVYILLCVAVYVVVCVHAHVFYVCVHVFLRMCVGISYVCLALYLCVCLCVRVCSQADPPLLKKALYHIFLLFQTRILLLPLRQLSKCFEQRQKAATELSIHALLYPDVSEKAETIPHVLRSDISLIRSRIRRQ